MLITSKQKRNCLQNRILALRYNDIDIKMATCDKILDIQVDENLIWSSHCQQVHKKVSSYLWLLCKIRSFLSIEHRLLFYKAYIKTHLGMASCKSALTSPPHPPPHPGGLLY